MTEALGDFVKNGLEQADTSSFPLVLRDMELNAKRLNHELDPNHQYAIELSCGKVGSIQITPGWNGNINVSATNIELSFSFSAIKAMSNGVKQAMSGSEDSDLAAALAASREEQQAASAPPAAPGALGRHAARGSTSLHRACFCSAHDTSEKRHKLPQPEVRECALCKKSMSSTYRDFKLCATCSGRGQQCLLCGISVNGQQDHAYREHAHLSQHPEAHAYNQQVPHSLFDDGRGALLGKLLGMLPSRDFWNACTTEGCQVSTPEFVQQDRVLHSGVVVRRLVN